jgi:transcriptional regulator with XRE-family HTH domain
MNDMGRKARSLLARKLKVLRMLRGWSQEDLAAASGLHRTYISLVERGECNISLDNLERLAEAFGLNLPELLGVSDATRSGARLPAKLTKQMGYKGG